VGVLERRAPRLLPPPLSTPHPPPFARIKRLNAVYAGIRCGYFAMTASSVAAKGDLAVRTPIMLVQTRTLRSGARRETPPPRERVPPLSFFDRRPHAIVRGGRRLIRLFFAPFTGCPCYTSAQTWLSVCDPLFSRRPRPWCGNCKLRTCLSPFFFPLGDVGRIVPCSSIPDFSSFFYPAF